MLTHYCKTFIGVIIPQEKDFSNTMTKASKDDSSNKATKSTTKKTKTSKPSSTSTTTSVKVRSGGTQKILDFTLFLETRSDNPEVPRKQVQAMAGLKPTTFPVTISNMKKKGLIEYDKDNIRLTDVGRLKANPVDDISMMDNTSAHEEIKSKFKIGGKAAELFDILAQDGQVHERESIIGHVGIKKNSAAVMLSNLKKNGVIEYDRTTIQLTDICFPFGRPDPSE